MLTCPHCGDEICIRELPHQGLFKSHRICPKCDGSFTPDTDTKYRQAVFILILIISLVITLLLYFEGTWWLIPAIFCYVTLGIILYWGNKHMFLVPYPNDRDKN
jgi:uncharacterized protein (DUF983 family)